MSGAASGNIRFGKAGSTRISGYWTSNGHQVAATALNCFSSGSAGLGYTQPDHSQRPYEQAATLSFLLLGPAMVKETLHVGTTGDYPPVTWRDPATGQYSGDDIAMVEAFAADTGYAVTFVSTTWPTMLDDLAAARFQLVVGGISATPKRAEAALLSDPIAITGKVALVRCGDTAKYTSLGAIDRPGVRVVENTGGTNESFAETRLKVATVTLVSDNASAFAALEKGTADVMFTDSIEARWHQSQHEGLCAVHPDQPYTRIAKVFLFAKDQAALCDAFNRWLDAVAPS